VCHGQGQLLFSLPFVVSHEKEEEEEEERGDKKEIIA
jgi:hypothetical protein